MRLYVNSIGSLGVSKPVTSYNRLGKRERNHFPRGESYLAAWDSFGRLGQLREYDPRWPRRLQRTGPVDDHEPGFIAHAANFAQAYGITVSSWRGMASQTLSW